MPGSSPCTAPREALGPRLAVTARFRLGPSWEQGHLEQPMVVMYVSIGHSRTGGPIRLAQVLATTVFGCAADVALPVPRRHAATLRRWLAGHGRVFALVTIKATSGRFEPPTTVEVMRSTRLTP